MKVSIVGLEAELHVQQGTLVETQRQLIDAESRTKGERSFSEENGNRYSSILIECCYQRLKEFYSPEKIDRFALNLYDSEPYWTASVAAYEAMLKDVSPSEAAEATKVVKEPNVEVPHPDASGVDQSATPSSFKGNEPPQLAVEFSSLLAREGAVVAASSAGVAEGDTSSI